MIETLRNTRVLVVDDNATNRKILAGLLARWDMTCTLAASGAEGLDLLAAANTPGNTYQLVITDMHMPAMDGFEFTERVRQSHSYADVPIVMLSSAGDGGSVSRRKTLNLDSYLVKPVRRRELGETIAGALNKRTHRAVQDAECLAPAAPCPANQKTMRILVAEDNPVNQKLVSRLLEKRGHEVVIVGSGLEALTAWEASRFDLVLMDVQMPGMDGLEATAKIRAREADGDRHQRVIALTAHAMKGDMERCLAAGMDGYLSKPIRVPELDALLEEVARTSELTATSSRS